MICAQPGEILYPGLADNVFGLEGRWALAECRLCGLVWIEPEPKAGEIAGFYSGYYTHDDNNYDTWFVRAVTRDIPSVVLGYEDALKGKRRRLWGRMLSLAGPLREAGCSSLLWLNAENRGRILDVGCGAGVFLGHMQYFGWDVYGVEPDAEASARARNALKTDNIYTGFLQDAGLKERDFDALTMSHVIEHLLEPEETLRDCYNLLKPGGLLVLATPNSGSLGRRIFGRNWRGWEPPRHIRIFNSDTLGRMVSAAGFTIDKIFTPSTAAYYNCTGSLIIKKNEASGHHTPNRGLNIIMKALSIFFWGLEYILARCGLSCGEEVVLFARRAE